jgi:hypothetical protein
LTGPNAELGKVPAADVARFLLGLERVAARAAMALVGKTVVVGRRGRAIESAVHLRLLSLTRGSVVAELEVPEPAREDSELDLDVRTLGEQAIDATLRAASGEADANPDVVEALVTLINELAVGDRYESAWFERVSSGEPRIVIDRERTTRLRGLARQHVPSVREDRIVGTLVEADFEKRTARLRTPDGKALVAQFADDLAGEIQMALRRPAELEGRISLDPRTSQATSVELRQVWRADQLALGLEPDAFWSNPTIEELRLQRGVEAVSDLSVLRDNSATADEIDAFMAAVVE